MSFTTTATIASFGGKLLKLTHEAEITGCEMALNLYLPPNAGKTNTKVPVLFYLAGLTCTGDNGAEKGFFQYGASQKGIAVVYPDTSPRTEPFFLTRHNITQLLTSRTRRTKNRRRRRLLGFWHWRRFLPRRNRLPLFQKLQNGFLYNVRAPKSSLLFFSRTRLLPHVHFWPQHGRPWRFDVVFEESGNV